MEQYFYIDGNEQFGPFSYLELMDKNISAETLIWHQGLEQWTPARLVKDLEDILNLIPPMGASADEGNISLLLPKTSPETMRKQQVSFNKIESLSDFKECPYCGEEILASAKKCKYCNEWLNNSALPIRNHEAVKPVINYSRGQEQTIILNQVERQSNGVGTAGFVLALIALFLSWIPGVGWFMWFLGLLLSFIGMFKKPRGLAITGFLISMIDLIILLFVVALIAGFINEFF
jgi:predicted RNA-binding Zn-ribbon protein involved in translation (DUF1610 family)